MTITGVRGGAYQGREIAGVLFTNHATRPCSLSGYPLAQLLRSGKPVGSPAKNESGTVRTVVLRPNQTAQVTLTAVTTCQAPESDAIRVRLAGWHRTVDVRDVQLRACSLSVNPVVRS